jgi:predicted nicotinamide N-methyase
MPSSHDRRELELLGEVAHTGLLHDDIVAIPGSPASLRVTRPASIDQILDQAASDPEQNLPYWAELWPSGIALGAYLLHHRDLVHDKLVLELGCGVGITAAIALGIGAEVIATDYAPEALSLTRLTSLRHAGHEPETVQVNWRDAEDPLLSGSRRFSVILAADVLYERRDIIPLLDLMDRMLEPDGLFLLAEPGRPPARAFLEQAVARGWRDRQSTCDGPWPDGGDEGVVVRIHELSSGSLPQNT